VKFGVTQIDVALRSPHKSLFRPKYNFSLSLSGSNCTVQQVIVPVHRYRRVFHAVNRNQRLIMLVHYPTLVATEQLDLNPVIVHDLLLPIPCHQNQRHETMTDRIICSRLDRSITDRAVKQRQYCV